MTDARAAVLGRVRAALGSATAEQARSQYARIDRSYQQTGTLDWESRLSLFVQRLREYDAEVHQVGASEIAATVARIYGARRLTRVLAPHALPESWLRSADSVQFIQDEFFSTRELDGFKSVITAATLGIAETGSVVLQSVPGQGRRALTLVPDHHVCVVRGADVVETVVEAMQRLESTRHLPTTFFSGPSATADIEMTRIKGVHGPRFVDVLLVDDGVPAPGNRAGGQHVV